MQLTEDHEQTTPTRLRRLSSWGKISREITTCILKILRWFSTILKEGTLLRRSLILPSHENWFCKRKGFRGSYSPTSSPTSNIVSCQHYCGRWSLQAFQDLPVNKGLAKFTEFGLEFHSLLASSVSGRLSRKPCRRCSWRIWLSVILWENAPLKHETDQNRKSFWEEISQRWTCFQAYSETLEGEEGTAQGKSRACP